MYLLMPFFGAILFATSSLAYKQAFQQGARVSQAFLANNLCLVVLFLPLLVLRDVTEGQAQGAAVALPVKFLSGPMRGTFHPQDGHLYVAGSTGWQTSAARDGALQRVRYTGKSLRTPVAWRAHKNGIALTFAQPLDRLAAEDAGRYAAHQWNYLYSANYGSKDYSVANPGQEGRDEVEVRSAKLLADGRTVFLELPGLRPVMQMELKYNLLFAGGGTASSPLYVTLNRLAEPLP